LRLVIGEMVGKFLVHWANICSYHLWSHWIISDLHSFRCKVYQRSSREQWWNRKRSKDR